MIKQAIITHYRTEEAKVYRKIHGDREAVVVIRISIIAQVPIPIVTAFPP